MAKVVLKLSDFPASPEFWQRLSHEHTILEALPEKLPSELAESIEALLPSISVRVDKAMMASFPALRVIANYGAGVDNIDVVEATRRGIQVTNTPGVLGEAVADLTWGLILSTCRRLVESDATVRNGGFTGWDPFF